MIAIGARMPKRMKERTNLLPVIAEWGEAYGRVFTQVEVFEEAVREVCGRHGLSCERVSGGFPGTCPVFPVDDAHVVKFYPPMVADDQPRELFCYERLTGRDALVPAVLADGVLEDRVDWPYLVIEHRNGRAIREVMGALSPEEKVQIATRVAEFVRRVHACEANDADGRFQAWDAFLGRQTASLVEAHVSEGALPRSVCEQIPAFVDAYLEPTDTRVLLHADLTEDHLLVERTPPGQRPAAVIDFADAEIGEPAYEWVALCIGMFNRDPVMVRAFFGAWSGERIDLAWRRRMLAWTFVYRFGPGVVSWVLEQAGRPAVGTVDDLIELVWPSSFER